MKKVAYLCIVLILLAVLAVPAMAKSPSNNGNGNGAGHGNGNGGGQEVSQSSNPTAGNQGNQHNQHNQGNRGNNGAKGNGNHGQSHPNTPFYLQGTITGVFSDTQTISVTVTHANVMVKQFIGMDITIKVTDATQIFKITQGDEDKSGEGTATTPTTITPVTSSDQVISSSGSTTNDDGDSNRVPITFGDLAVGQRVAIHGNLVEGVYTARLITVYIGEPVGEPAGDQP